MKIKTLLTCIALAATSLASAQSAPDTSLPKIVLTTTKQVGEKIRLAIGSEGHRDDDGKDTNIWIDLNNNGVKEPGEVPEYVDFDHYVPLWDDNYNYGQDFYEEYTLGARTITIYGDVTDLGCRDNNLIALDMTQNPNMLLTLDCRGNQLTSLDFSRQNSISTIVCSHNGLTSLDIGNSEGGKLYCLDCSYNKLTHLSVARKTTSLYCSHNNLSYLDLSDMASEGNFAVDCSHNKLTEIKLPKNGFERLSPSGTKDTFDDYVPNFSHNLLGACALNAIYEAAGFSICYRPREAAAIFSPNQATLSKTRSTRLITTYCNLFVAGNPGASTSNTNIAVEKGWRMDVKGDGSAECPEAGISEETAGLLQIYPNPAREELRVSLPGDIQFGTLAIYDMTGKKVYSQSIGGTYETIDIRAFAPGLYVVKINNIAHKVMIK